MTLKQVAIVGAFIGSGVGGFITARIAKEPAAIAAPISPDKRLEAIELRLQAIDLSMTEVVRTQASMARDVGVIKCRLNIEGLCPP